MYLSDGQAGGLPKRTKVIIGVGAAVIVGAALIYNRSRSSTAPLPKALNTPPGGGDKTKRGPVSPGLSPGGKPIGPIKQAGSINVLDLHPDFQPLVWRWLDLVKAAGIEARATATLRTPAVQDALYAQGRFPHERVNEIRVAAGLPPIPQTETANVVSNAKGDAFASWHMLGLAFDFYVQNPAGYGWKTPPPEWQKAADIGKSLGMVWGGDWPHPDYPHLEWHPWTSSTAPTKGAVALFKKGSWPKDNLVKMTEKILAKKGGKVAGVSLNGVSYSMYRQPPVHCGSIVQCWRCG